MPFEREKHIRNFTKIDNNIFQNTELSLKARGLLSTLLSLPDEWQFSKGGLYAICKDSENSVNKAMAELKEKGYLTIEKKEPNAENGGRYKYIYTIYEKPKA